MTKTTTTEATKPRVRTPEVAAAYLFNRVCKMKREEEGVVEAARLKFRARIAALVAKAPADVQKAFFALSGTNGESDGNPG